MHIPKYFVNDWLLSVTAAALFGVSSLAGAAESTVTLKVGDPAPKLEVSKWVQGEPVKEFQRDQVYLVEFWATWCGPCRTSIPHVNELHKKYKDKGLVVIGQDVLEDNPAQVEEFVSKQGDQMTYRVALDAPNPDGKGRAGKMATTWLEAAGQGGIPTAFMVDKTTRIIWIGHPMQLTEAMIEQILAGTFDGKKVAAEKAKLEGFWEQFAGLMETKQWDKAAASLSEFERGLPEAKRDPSFGMARFEILVGKQDFKAATAFADKFSEERKDDAMVANYLAWELLTNEGYKQRDLDTIAKIAARANEAAHGKDGPILDTLARVAFMQGKHKKAVELQQKAVELTQGPHKAELEKTLQSYKAGKLPSLK